MLDEEAGGDHPHAIVHPARRPELPHSRVDDRIAGAASRPCLEIGLARSVADRAPGKAVELLAPVFLAQPWKLLHLAKRKIPTCQFAQERPGFGVRSEEQTSELQSLMRISYAVFCLKKNNK